MRLRAAHTRFYYLKTHKYVVILMIIIKIAVIVMVLSISLILSSSVAGLLGNAESTGKIIAAHANPTILTAGQNEVFDIAVKSYTNNSDFNIEVMRDSLPVASAHLNFVNSSIKVISLKSSIPPSTGKSKYTFNLYSGRIAINRAAISSLSEVRRIYSLREVSDADNDGLMYFEEIELGTDPFLEDTDGDGIKDNIDYEQVPCPLC